MPSGCQRRPVSGVERDTAVAAVPDGRVDERDALAAGDVDAHDAGVLDNAGLERDVRRIEQVQGDAAREGEGDAGEGDVGHVDEAEEVADDRHGADRRGAVARGAGDERRCSRRRALRCDEWDSDMAKKAGVGGHT